MTDPTTTTTVFQAVVLEPVGVVIGDEDEYIDEETIGLYINRNEAQWGIERYIAARLLDEAVSSLSELGHMEFDIRTIPLNKDLIYPQAAR